MSHGTEPEPGSSSIPRPAESAARLLHPSRPASVVLDTDALTHIAKGLAEAIAEAPAAPAGAIERIPLLSTEGYDAWLVVWGPGATLEAHDHDGSIGVMHVLSGTLLETAGDLDGSEVPPLRRLDAGSTSEFAAAHRHALCNEGDEVVVSIGVYSPPLAAPEG
jgi:quercetin dioxygenase-like cupin family protein